MSFGCHSCRDCAGCGNQEKLVPVDAKHFYSAFFLVFILPIIVLVILLAVGEKYHWPEKISLLVGALGWLSSYAVAYRYDKYLQTKSLYRTLK